ncbi:hypothetical protein [Intestinibacter sp.]|uniref:hypothetical protein n=1 Tax=Intestinibacter sp. TaxID=1965304 RepID=UPI003F17DBEF
MKHPSGGFIAFNTIYLDYDNQYSNGPGNVADGISGSSDYGTFYPQTQKIEESINYTQYPNFSYPLYLILSRIYTKNKTIPSNGESVRLSNYVRRE